MKLYIGNLASDVTEAKLRELVTAFGNPESVHVVTDRDSGASRGFGFVEMSDAEANAAIAGLNGKEVSGKALVVNEARPKVERGGGGRGGGR
ncbi:MAG TPA: RNA-binding protein [Thermoanaerobaculia bacterium]|nr:RNA-binding protein [Thermoanaerobaculia bacterium]